MTCLDAWAERCFNFVMQHDCGRRLTGYLYCHCWHKDLVRWLRLQIGRVNVRLRRSGEY